MTFPSPPGAARSTSLPWLPRKSECSGSRTRVVPSQSRRKSPPTRLVRSCTSPRSEQASQDVEWQLAGEPHLVDRQRLQVRVRLDGLDQLADVEGPHLPTVPVPPVGS